MQLYEDELQDNQSKGKIIMWRVQSKNHKRLRVITKSDKNVKLYYYWYTESYVTTCKLCATLVVLLICYFFRWCHLFLTGVIPRWSMNEHKMVKRPRCLFFSLFILFCFFIFEMSWNKRVLFEIICDIGELKLNAFCTSLFTWIWSHN